MKYVCRIKIGQVKRGGSGEIDLFKLAMNNGQEETNETIWDLVSFVVDESLRQDSNAPKYDYMLGLTCTSRCWSCQECLGFA